MKALKYLLVSLGFLSLAVPVIATDPWVKIGTGTQTALGTAMTTVVHTSKLTISVRFLSTGSIQVLQGSKVIASGVPFLSSYTKNYTPTSTTAVTLTAAHGQITQIYAASKIKVLYDCMLSGADLTISAHITNNGTTPLSSLIMVAPSFTFSTTPTGTMPSWHYSYLAANGLSIYHPGYAAPIGCVTAADKNYAVAVWSPSEMTTASLIQATWVADGVLPNPLPIELHTTETISAGASLDISLSIRTTANQTNDGLLSGYKALLPTMSYTPVAKPVTAFQAIDAAWVTPTDPYGYDGANRRLDLPQGVQAYLKLMTPSIKANGAAGIIFWAPGGYQTTTMYPVDFDVNLTRIASTWPGVVTGLQAGGFRTGICARLADALNPDGSMYRADPTNAKDVATMLARVDSVANTGVDMWYIDSACNDPASTTMTAIAKKHLPANHIFYTEFASDVSISFAAVYCEWIGTQTHWLTESQRAQLLYLYPNSTWLCKDKTGTTTSAQLTALGFQPLSED